MILISLRIIGGKERGGECRNGSTVGGEGGGKANPPSFSLIKLFTNVFYLNRIGR